MALTDEEFHARLQVLDKVDELIEEARRMVRAAQPILAPAHRLWWSATEDMYDAWRDSVIGEWAQEDEEKKPGGQGATDATL